MTSIEELMARLSPEERKLLEQESTFSLTELRALEQWKIDEAEFKELLKDKKVQRYVYLRDLLSDGFYDTEAGAAIREYSRKRWETLHQLRSKFWLETENVTKKEE